MGWSGAPDLVLAAPGLASAVPAWFDQPGLMPAAESLTRLLAQADRLSSPVVSDDGVLSLFGLPPADVLQPPWAALARAGEAGGPEPGHWLRLDPVHLRPDMAQLLLFAAPDVTLTGEEAQALGAIIAECVAELGTLHVLHPDRWYLRLHAPTDLATVPPQRIAGHDVRDALPTGAAGRRWRTLINEIQMLLFEHPVNQAREARGQPAVNSVWPWGAGAAPALRPAGYRSVTADSPVVRGLGRLAGVESVGEDTGFARWLSGTAAAGEHLVWLAAASPPAHPDPEAWGAWLTALERDWFAPLVPALRGGALNSVLLHSGDGQAWRVSSRALRRFWRRPAPLTRRLRLQGAAAP